jgi:polysaccharide biosynthesis protein PslH
VKVLFLTTVLPARQLHGSEIASQNIIEALQANGCDVTVMGYGRQEDGECRAAPHEIMVADRAVETKRAKFKAIGWYGLSMAKNLPYSAAKYITQTYIQQVKAQLQQHHYDAIVLDHAQLAWLLQYVDRQIPVICIAHNLEHDMYFQHWRNATNRLAKWVYRREASLVQKLENQLAITANQIWTFTEFDADYFRKIAGAGHVQPLRLPSGFVPPERNPGMPKQFDIGIIGSWSWKPNVEGLEWFLQEVYPHLPRHCTIHVAGRGVDWLTGKYPNITYRGFVKSAQAFMDEAKVMAIPTLSGGGIQIKTLDAIASGAMIVATSVAMRGIEQPPTTVAIADTGVAFAQQLVKTIAAVDHPAVMQQTAQIAKDWHHDRARQFVQEVGKAISGYSDRGL